MEKALVEHDILLVNRVQVAFTHTHIMYRIKNISFTATIFSDKGIESISQLNFSALVIFKLNQMYSR
jgi:hypothetical protein